MPVLRSAPVRFLTWLGGHELAVLLALGAIAAGIWGFAMLADEVKEGDTQSIDRRILLAMRNPRDLSPIGSPAVQEAARDVTALGGVVVLAFITLTVAGFLALDGKGRMALFVCGAVLGGLLASLLLKDLFNRPRPDIVPRGSYVSTSSFPSGHSMMSAVTYLTLGALLARAHRRLRLKAYFLILAAVLCMVVGISRVYLGVHWPTDVLAGWTAGAVWALLCWLVARRLQGVHALEAEDEHAVNGQVSA